MNKKEVEYHMPWFASNSDSDQFEEIYMLEGKYGVENAVKHISDLQDGDIVAIWNTFYNKEAKAVFIARFDLHSDFGVFEYLPGEDPRRGLWNNRDILSPSDFPIYIVEKKHRFKTDCECGARHTSFKNYHLDWCPLYNKAVK